MLLKRIGHNISRLRKQLNLSQIDLAVAVGVTRSYLSEIENGKRNPTIMLLQNIATVLSVSLEDLIK
jgi:transcriptional regulator with XRE-family HTH domain